MKTGLMLILTETMTFDMHEQIIKSQANMRGGGKGVQFRWPLNSRRGDGVKPLKIECLNY